MFATSVIFKAKDQLRIEQKGLDLLDLEILIAQRDTGLKTIN